MAKRHRGPTFRRAQDQRVVIGPYEPSPRPELPENPPPTLLEKLRARIEGLRPGKGRRGPDFTHPDGVARVGRYERRRNRRSKSHSRRPTDFLAPSPEQKA
ncbi:hypothetical protein LKO27_07765 [Tessaracoccus sp. OS52]|uniref:hypothetical protein n=1 Tax=Tessaracoccus sp. OS52 TaxID=2886691 RepID=UPI001D1299CA|nr:hypothetical protein [Tessaracoccus sp. OS52]MCC2593304.1 hypothetical protein [Tessaracoccus sp. OS52]